MDRNKVTQLLTEALKYKKCLLDLHDDHSSCYNHLGLHGFKRWHECQYKEEWAEFVSLRRYIDDEFFKRVIVSSDYKTFEYMIFNSAFKKDINNKEKIDILKLLIQNWVEWEGKYTDKLDAIAHMLEEENDQLSKEHIECMIFQAREEMKELRRVIELYGHYNWDIAYIAREQQDMHDKCETRMQKIYKIDIA